MAKKPTITTVATGYQATDTINDNFTALRDGFDNTISRDGSTPNAMAADLDMGGNDLLNVGTLQVDSIIYGDEPLAVQFGGTGADTAAGARTNLGLGTLATQSGTFSGSFSGSHTGTTSGTNTGDQNTFTTVAVAGQDSVAADSGTDTLTLVAGTGITITTNAATDSITITNTGEGGGGGGGGTIDLATDVTGVLAVVNGGTGASTAGDARTSLGLGSIATQNSSSVTITGGSVSGITDLAVADGGTGSSTAAGARANLGISEKVFFIVASGQSNAMGSNSDSTGGDQVVNPYVKAWNGSAWVTATLGVAPFSTGTPTKNNVNFQFAKAIQENFGGTVYLVLSGQGNTSISEWLTTNATYAQWTNLNNAVNAALATTELTAAGKTSADVFTWFQGENDFANTSYGTNFLALRTQAISAGWLESTTPVIAGSIANNASQSRIALTNLTLSFSNNWFALASNIDCPLAADGIHYTGTGYEIMGRRHWLAAWKELPKTVPDFVKITPRMFGAVADGTTNDVKAIQAAIDAAKALSGTYVEVDLEGRNYLISESLLLTGSSASYIKFHNGELIAKSSSGVWTPDGTFPTGTGYSTRSMLEISSNAAKGVVQNIVFDCADVTNGIHKQEGSGGAWHIRENEIINFDRWGIRSDDVGAAGGTRIELNWITEKSPSTYQEVRLTGNTTNGSATISSIIDTTNGVNNTNNLTIGQTVAGINIPFDARIVSKTSTSITLNKNATATSTGAVLGVTDYHGLGFWHNNVDEKITGNTIRWCLCPFFADGAGEGAGSTALVSNNHFYNGGGTYARWQSRIIYLGSGSNSNIFTNNYLDNGIIELRGLDQAFLSNRIAATDADNSEAIFLLVATKVDQVLSSGGGGDGLNNRFIAFGFELPRANVAKDATPLFKFKADPGYNWAAGTGTLNNLVLSDDTHNSLFSTATQEVVANGDNLVKRLVSSGTRAYLKFKDKTTSNEPFIGSNQDDLVFGQGSSTAMRINSAQKVQIGGPSLTATDALLQVAVPSATVGAITTQVSTTSGRRHVRFEASGVEAGWISTSAGTTSYNTASDYRLKEDIQPITSASSRVHALNPVRFKWNYIDGSPIVDGFIAHEVQKVVPEAVSGRKDEVNPDGTPIYQAIDPAKLVPLLTAALQEALLRIETLEAKVG